MKDKQDVYQAEYGENWEHFQEKHELLSIYETDGVTGLKEAGIYGTDFVSAIRFSYDETSPEYQAAMNDARNMVGSDGAYARAQSLAEIEAQSLGADNFTKQATLDLGVYERVFEGERGEAMWHNHRALELFERGDGSFQTEGYETKDLVYAAVFCLPEGSEKYDTIIDIARENYIEADGRLPFDEALADLRAKAGELNLLPEPSQNLEHQFADKDDALQHSHNVLTSFDEGGTAQLVRDGFSGKELIQAAIFTFPEGSVGYESYLQEAAIHFKDEASFEVAIETVKEQAAELGITHEAPEEKLDLPLFDFGKEDLPENSFEYALAGEGWEIGNEMDEISL